MATITIGVPTKEIQHYKGRSLKSSELAPGSCHVEIEYISVVENSHQHHVQVDTFN